MFPKSIEFIFFKAHLKLESRNKDFYFLRFGVPIKAIKKNIFPFFRKLRSFFFMNLSPLSLNLAATGPSGSRRGFKCSAVSKV